MFLSRGAATGDGNIQHHEMKISAFQRMPFPVPESLSPASFCPRYDLIKVETQDVCAGRFAIGNSMLGNHLIDSARLDV